MDPRHLGDGRRTLQVAGAASDTLVLCQSDLVNDQWFSAPPARVLTGDEPFIGCAATVYDFWRFAMSDLRMNNVRGYLAESLVARAVQAVGQRIEWDAFDVLTPDGVKVEVKSSAYLQVWDQRAPSRIVFSGLRGKTWSPQQGEASEATYNADVYVFAVHTALRHDQYDALDVRQWEFYVLPRETIERLGYKSLGLSTLRTITGEATPYGELADAIAAAASRGTQLTV